MYEPIIVQVYIWTFLGGDPLPVVDSLQTKLRQNLLHDYRGKQRVITMVTSSP